MRIAVSRELPRVDCSASGGAELLSLDNISDFLRPLSLSMASEESLRCSVGFEVRSFAALAAVAVVDWRRRLPAAAGAKSVDERR